MSLSDIRRRCVDAFPSSARRPRLVSGLETLVRELAVRIDEFQLWVDGSFLTQKPEPDDIDVVLVVDPAKLNSAPSDTIDWLKGALHRATAKAKFDCDIYFVPSDDVAKLAYWRGWFGFFRDGTTAKGIALLEVTP